MLKRSLLLLPLALAACTGTYNRGVESVHQPIVSRADYTFDVGVDGRGLSPGESQRLAGWMDSLRLGYGDRVAIDDPRGDPRARSVIAAEAAQFGLLVSDDLPVTGAPVAPGTVRVVVSRFKATVPGCPDFSRMSLPNYESHTSSDYGCATNANLAAMVASPADLVRGQPGTGTNDAAASARAIDAFRKAVPSGGGGTIIKSDSASGGSGSGGH